MKTIFSPVLTPMQADGLFPADENLKSLPAIPKAYELLAEIVQRHGFKILGTPTIEPRGLEHAFESYVLPEIGDVQVCAVCQVSPGTVVKFICQC